jgi:hypothetical protein
VFSENVRTFLGFFPWRIHRAWNLLETFSETIQGNISKHLSKRTFPKISKNSQEDI